MNKKTILLAIFILLLMSTVLADGIESQKRMAARQKIRPELLQAMDELENRGKEIAPLYGKRMASGRGGSESKSTILNKSLVKTKPGKVRVLVSIEHEIDLGKASRTVANAGGKVKGKFEAGKTVFAEVPLEKLEEIAANPEVKEIWPDFELTAMEEPFEQINAGDAWNLGLQGQGIKIAVLDTGIDETHPALAGKVAAAENFSSSGTATDSFGHGTHVAGIIAGSGQVQGVAPEAMLLNGKVLNDSGSGTASSVIAGINWAIEQEADVINLSLGAPIAEQNTPLNQAVRDAITQGIVVVVAAGNCGQGCPSSSCNGFVGITMPGNTKEAITVGAIDRGNNATCFSGNGMVQGILKPDIVAPGIAIISSIPGGLEAKSGTSMATPFAAAAIALVLQQNPEFGHFEAKNFLEQTAFDLGAEGEDIIYGWGLIDLSRLEEDINTVPDENVWQPPDTNNGSDIDFLESEFTFSGPETIYKLTEGSYSVWHEGTAGQEISQQEQVYLDTIVEFVVLNEFGEVVDRYFDGPREHSPTTNISFDYDWMPKRTGNFTVKATIYQEGIAISGIAPNDIRAATAEKTVKTTVPADMLQISNFVVQNEIEQGTNAQFLLSVQNTGYLDENVVAEIRLEDEAGNIFKIISGEAQNIAIGQTGEFNLGETIELPDGNYNAKAIVFFEDRNVSAESEINVFFPANCNVQNLSIPTIVETGSVLQGTIEFSNETNLKAIPAFFGKILDGNETVGQIFFDGNIVDAQATRQYSFEWNANASPGEYDLNFEVKYNGNIAKAGRSFTVEDTTAPKITFVLFQESVAQNAFNPIKAIANDFTGIANVTAIVQKPDGQKVVELEQTGFDQNSEWSKAFVETESTGVYSLQVQACDFYGNCAVSEEVPFMVEELQSNCNERNVLLVESNTGFSFDANEFRWMEELEQGRQCMQLWKKSIHGNLDLNYLQRFDAVVWSSGNRFGESVDVNDAQLLADYVNSGGRLLLEGSDIASEHVSDELMQAVAKAEWENEPYTDANASTIEFEQSGFITSIESTGFDLNKAPFFDTLTEVQGEVLARYEGQPVMTYGWDTNTGSKTVFSAIAFSSIDEANRNEIAGISIEWLLEKVLFGSILHLKEMPSYTKDENHYSGAAVAEMILNYVRQKAGYSDLNQEEIFEYGNGFAAQDFNAYAMDAVLGHFDPYDENVVNYYDRYDGRHGGNPFQGYNYTIEAFDPATNPDAMNDYMRDIVHWMAYPVTKEAWWLDGELVAAPNTPAAIPLYGSYNRWVALNGFAVSGNPAPNPHQDPWYTPKVTIYGFWLTDPAKNGIGSHVYVTAADANSLYFKPMQAPGQYSGKLVQIAEPPVEKPAEGIMAIAGIEAQDNARKAYGAKARIARPVAMPKNLEIIKQMLEKN